MRSSPSRAAARPLLDGRARTGRCACPAGGEQQRLGVARALVNKPDWLFLDEATAGLDPEAEARMCVQLKRRLPGITITSIGHNRPSGGSTDSTWCWTGPTARCRRHGANGVGHRARR